MKDDLRRMSDDEVRNMLRDDFEQGNLKNESDDYRARVHRGWFFLLFAVLFFVGWWVIWSVLRTSYVGP